MYPMEEDLLVPSFKVKIPNIILNSSSNNVLAKEEL